MPTRRDFLRTTARGTLVAASPGLAGGFITFAQGARADHGGPHDMKSLLRPVKIASSSGDVRNAHALVSGGVATLNMAAGGAAPQVVLDYGREVGGLPVFEIKSVSGSPILEAIYSEALPRLFPTGDGPAPGTPDTGAAAAKDISFVGIAGGTDLARTERFHLDGARRIENRLLQGGLRFQALRLASPGAVELRLVGLLPSIRLSDHKINSGSFACSDAALTEIWQMGADTLNGGSIPAGSVPRLWDVTSEGIRVGGSAYSGYVPGVSWTDYTATFDVKIVANEASWLVRGTFPNGLRMVLCAADDTLLISRPNTLRLYVQFTKQLLGEVPLPFDLRLGSWHAARTEVAGSTARVFLDEHLLTTVTLPAGRGLFGSIAAGWVGFGNAQGAEALFRNLKVVQPNGQVLYQSPLTDPAVLNLFCADTNEFPSIVDGPKRDRMLFTGDLGVAGMNTFASNWALDYLAGAIHMFSAYQLADGSIATSIPPQANPGKTPGDFAQGEILDYTVHHITTIYNYWFHTGDRRFLVEQWPVVERVLAYLAANRNAQGLLMVGATAETLANAHYYGALQMAAQMAMALGKPAEAAMFEGAAPPLRAAINANLFNETLGLYGTNTGNLAVAPQHGNAYAVLYGVPPAERVPSILQKLAAALFHAAGPVQASSGSTRIGPYTAGYDLLARFDAGDTAGALDIVRRVWNPMRSGSDYATGTAWEYVTLDGKPGLGAGTSLCHPWSTMPTPALSKYVLGIRPLEPGYRAWLVEPQPGDIASAQGKVPTPLGPIEVRWEKKPDRFLLSVNAPPRTRGKIGMPGGSSKVTRNGRPVATQSATEPPDRPGYTYVHDASSGVYEQRND